MKLRLADEKDLPLLKKVFTEIVAEMTNNCGEIWDEYYPCELFAGDIEKKQLYVLDDNGIIVAAYVLCGTNEAEGYIKWQDKNAKVLYIDRFGVNVHYQHKGIAGMMLRFATDIAREIGAEYLRLFVVDRNFPAISLYEKSGFKRMDGIYNEHICDDLYYPEYGYEKKIN